MYYRGKKKRIMKVWGMFKVFLVLAIIALPSLNMVSFGQHSGDTKELWANESFGSMNMSAEIIGKRSEFSKHFKNENGKITALITAGPMHYSENGKWNTIYHSLIPNSTGFENTTNKHKTYYPATASGNIVTILENGITMKDMIGMRMYYQAGNQEIQTKNIAGAQGNINFNELTYNNVYGNGIDLRLAQNTTNRKMDYIIHNKSALGNIPSNAEFLVFEEKVELPMGWKAVINEKKIDLKDATGKVVAFYDQPRYTDTDILAHHKHGANEPHEHHVNEIIGDYQITQQGNLLTIKTLVPVSWLKQDLNFPVFIDPTIHLYPNNSARWTGHHVTTSTTNCVNSGCANYTSTNITGSVDGDFMLGRYDTYQVYNGWIKFNVTDIPDDACISSAAFGYFAVDLNSYDPTCNVGTRIRHMATDPSLNDFSVGANNQARLADIRDGDIFNTLNTAVVSQGAGWRTVNLTANLNHLQSQLIPNWFAIGLHNHSGASGHITCRYAIMGHGYSAKPQLSVEYENAVGTDNITICSGQLPYNWYGQTINAGGNGVATRTGQSANGCDIEVTLNLTVNPGTPPQTENVTICSSELPYSWRGQSVTAGGNGAATHVATDANGCNYNIMLNLTVHPVTPPQTDNISICSNQLPYTWNGQVINTGGNGVATHTTQDANGCNVVTTLNLTVAQTVTNTDNITICSSELPYTWNGQTITAGGNGVATHTTQNGSGCDVVTTLNLTVIPVVTNTEDITICNNELPYTWHGQVITTGGNGVATRTTQDANGCDVITTLNLTINPAGASTENISICTSALPYTWYGQTITAGGNGIATHSGQDANGCDVIITLNLTVNPETTQTENIQICQNALPYTWNGQTITAGGNGVATHVTQNANGCNVTTTLNLTVSPVITLTNDETICQSQLPFIWNGQTITTGGNGIATHTTQDANGCDVVTTLNLTVIPSPGSTFTVQAENCTPAEVVITPVSVVTGNTYRWYVNGVLASSTPTFSSVVTNPGCNDVRLVVTNTNGCTSETTVNSAFCIEEAPVADFLFNGESASSINQIVQTTNTSTGANNYIWTLPNGSSTEFQPAITFESGEGTYSITLYAYTANGCVDSITKTIRYKEEVIFFVPNTFTPDNDEHNNSFGIVIASGIDIYNFSLIIFNRWGEKIWESQDPSAHWNGTYNGKMVQDGMYTWKLDFKETQRDKRHTYTGHINIIR